MASSDDLTEGFLAKETHFTERSKVLWANLSSSKGFEILIRYKLALPSTYRTSYDQETLAELE